MNYLDIHHSETLPAPPAQVYSLLADYRKGHPSILPPKYFKACEVLQGGTGAGTKIKVEMKVMGIGRSFVMDITEPAPGKVLVETDHQQNVVTTFTLEPHAHGSRLTIRTRQPRSAGLKGFIEKLTVPGLTRRIFQEEMELIRKAVSSS